MRRFALSTLGCRLNQYESEALASELIRRGWVPAQDPREADAILVNTCTVTAKAEAESRRLARRSRGAKVVLILGCAAEMVQSALGDGGPQLLFIPNRLKSQAVDILEAAWEGKELALEQADPFAYPAEGPAFRTRAFHKVQDGCAVHCSFCIVPSRRGPPVSRPLSQTLEAARRLIDGGCREIVLTGINLARWREGEKTLGHLVEALLNLEGDWRLRLSSLEPLPHTEGWVDLFAHPRLCRHLHLSLQSGSEAVLKRMRRPHTAQDWLRIALSLRHLDPRFHIGTDLIVGFPGETEADLEATVQLLEQVGIGRTHLFTFSPRAGTPAASLANRIPPSEAARRRRWLSARLEELKRRYLRTLVGLEETMLVEQAQQGRARGWTSRYLSVEVEAPHARPNQWLRIQVQAGEDEPLRATLLTSQAGLSLSCTENR